MNFTFEDLVGDEATFFGEYFNKKPMVRKNSLSRDPRELLSTRELDELVHLEVIRPPYIKLNHNGTGVPEKGYTRSVVVQGVNVHDSVVPEKIYELFRAGATVTWSSLNQVVPKTRDFSRMIAEKVNCRTDAVAFMTPARKKGYPPHHDPVELFIIQLEGTKRWHLWNPPAVRPGDSASYTREELGDPVVDVLLEPGDVLYLPYNTPHAAAAEDQVSLHLSIMMRPRMWKDLIRLTVEKALKEDPALNEYPYIGTLRTAETEAEFSAKLGDFMAGLAALTPSQELDRLADLGRHMEGVSFGNTFQSVSAADTLVPAVELRRSNATVEFGQDDNGRTPMTVNGHKIAVPSRIAGKLASLDAPVKAGELFPGADENRSTQAAQGLVRLGVLELAGSR